MIGMKIILWVMATLGIAIFLQFYFFPYIKNKWMLWATSKQIKRMAKKYNGETGELLKEISKQLMDLSKSQKLVNDDE